MSKLLAAALGLALAVSGLLIPGLASEDGRCTRVLGMSQTRNWFEEGGFESQAGIDPAEWELTSVGGADINQWMDPSFIGFTATPRSASCGGTPTRVLFHAAYLGFEQASDALIADGLSTVVANIRATWPSVARVALVPIVGGPDHSLCQIDGRTVDATRMHPRIDTAIAAVADGVGVLDGADLLVSSCADYADGLGHLLPSGSAFVAQTVASSHPFNVRAIHDRSVTLNLNGHLTARGAVAATDGFAACESGVSVKIQERGHGGGWRTVRTTTTDAGGEYRARLPDKPGSYRAVAPRVATATDVCPKDRSPRRRHRH
jgi:hypothetical protein